jgi:hypothetical protein
MHHTHAAAKLRDTDYRLPITKVGPLAHPVRSHTLAHRVQNNSKHTPMGPSWWKKGRQSKHMHKTKNHILSVLYVAEQCGKIQSLTQSAVRKLRISNCIKQ